MKTYDRECPWCLEITTYFTAKKPMFCNAECRRQYRNDKARKPGGRGPNRNRQGTSIQCPRPGCTNDRHFLAGGAIQWMCLEHMRPYWQRQQSVRRSKTKESITA